MFLFFFFFSCFFLFFFFFFNDTATTEIYTLSLHDALPIADWRVAFAAVAEEVATADSAIRDAERKQRDIDREVARLESNRAIKPPSKLEVRIDLAAAAATKATLRVTYAVRAARWTPRS